MPDSLRDRLQASLGAAYIIERELGGGGMSRVFVAEETRFRRRVVIKVLSPELAAELSAERFEREIALAAGLQQANIVPVITAGEVGELPFYSMPFVDGESLRARLQRGRVPRDEAISILRDVARALAYAHAQGVVHRDIKPENVLLSGGAAVVTDFGIAKALSAARTQAPGGTLTQIGTSLGTPGYMAPEQAAGDEVDHRADLYAWGVMAYEVLSGSHPFAGKATAQQLIAAHIAEVPPTLRRAAPDVPAPLAALVMQTLEKAPAARPASANIVVDALGGTATTGEGASPLRRADARTRRIMIAVVAVLAVTAGAAMAIRSRGQEQSADSDAAPKTITTLAVLPFVNTGGDSADEYFSDGMTEELALALARLPGLRIAGRTSSFSFKGKNATAPEVGRATG
jgi:serine/threonine-protein kinase